jgi:23S rRNA (uracil1939-C5)-methyltransferase
VAALTAAEAPVVVLVSCDPVSLARDVVLMAEAGYRAERVEVLDLFPNTHHVETVTRFVPAVV